MKTALKVLLVPDSTRGLYSFVIRGRMLDWIPVNGVSLYFGLFYLVVVWSAKTQPCMDDRDWYWFEMRPLFQIVRGPWHVPKGWASWNKPWGSF